jgi:hypothetical protein
VAKTVCDAPVSSSIRTPCPFTSAASSNVADGVDVERHGDEAVPEEERREVARGCVDAVIAWPVHREPAGRVVPAPLERAMLAPPPFPTRDAP